MTGLIKRSVMNSREPRVEYTDGNVAEIGPLEPGVEIGAAVVWHAEEGECWCTVTRIDQIKGHPEGITLRVTLAYPARP